MPARLQIRPVTFGRLINTDAGSGAKQNLATWKPDLEAGWFYLGPSATNSDQNPGPGVIVRELVPGTLVDVVGWQQVWNDSGSGNKTDFALWRGVAPNPDYVVVGGFFTRSQSPPSREEAQGIKAVHRDALVQARAVQETWNDSGSKSRSDGAVWTIGGGGGAAAVPTGAFVPVQGYNNPPSDVYALKAT